MVDGVLEVSIPAWMSKAEEGKWVDEMRRRSLRTEKGKGKGKGKGSSDLESRAQTLAGTWGFPVPTSVRWSPNMAHRWGSCTTVDGTIRISSRLVNVPDWVLDAVLINELAHLVHSDHSAAFWALVKRYPKHDMAAGFLEGMTYASSSSPPAP